MQGILVHGKNQVKNVKLCDDINFMYDAEKIHSLEMEIKKVALLGGKMAIVAVPSRFKEKVILSSRDMDTHVTYLDYELVAMIGASVNEASAAFMSVPKGIAIYPLDGTDLYSLVFLAIERLNQIGNSRWAKSFWESIKETSAAEQKEDPEIRFVCSTFYQFYSFIAKEADISGKIIDEMPPSSKECIKELLPSGVVERISKKDQPDDNDLDSVLEKWSYADKFERKKKIGSLTLRKFRNFEHLNTLPAISHKIIGIARDPDASASRMAAIIENDPAITSKVLKIVNSAFYGFHRKIESVEHAIVILGNNEVINLSISLALHKFIMNISSSKIKSLWMHCLLTGHLSYWLGTFFKSKEADLTYTIGLLHDIGKIALIQQEGYSGDVDKYSDIDTLAQEESEYGLSHAELGAYIADRWQLPEEIVDGLRAHHLPAFAVNKPLAATIHLADYVAHTGHLDADMINYSASGYLKRPDMTLSMDIISRTYDDMKKKIGMILSS
jgi:putative nucleotidyltransferase with HDIG domain